MKARVWDGAAMKAQRLALGITQRQLSATSGVSVSYLKALEAGPPYGGAWPSDRLARDIARALHCYPHDLSHPMSADPADTDLVA